MEIEKILNLSDDELATQERQTAEQLFRLRFQMRMGQNDGLEKLRAMKKDVARIKTVVRQRELGIVTTHTTEKPKAHKPVKATKTAKAESTTSATNIARTPAKPKRAVKSKAKATKAKKETR